MVSLGHQSSPPTNLGRVDEEMASPNKAIENHLTSVGAPCDDFSRTPTARSAPKLFTSTTPGRFYDEY
ncbi:hypothetical protein TNCV_717121 [Trichonephila clavipes]|nr:hypothetical protein TNCV_717121 [Trichonephila clavipes]